MKNKRIATFALAILMTLSPLVILHPATALYQGQAKPMEFYLHNLSTPVNVGGIQTTHIMNTTKAFNYQTIEQALANSFYKPEGQPKIDIPFYLYPNFAGPVTVDGSWEVSLWINASAYKPTTFSVQYQEISSSGQTIWDSGQINPTVTSSIGSYTDVPILDYKLSTQLAHTFTAGSTLLVTAEVNAGSTAETRIWYDSITYQSKVTLPAKDYARAATITTYNSEGDQTTKFATNTTDANRVVRIDANVTDPFGGYDVYQVNITITDPDGKRVVDNKDMTIQANAQWQTSYSDIYELKYSYPSTAAIGNYSIVITVIDNNGYNAQQATGNFDPFIEQNQATFSIGVITFYDPVIIIVDDNNSSLPGAAVYVTWRNGTVEENPRSTDQNGTIKLTNAPEGQYGFTVYYKNQIVQQATLQIHSNGPYTIKTLVYQLDVQVVDNNKQPVSNAFVIIYTSLGDGVAVNITETTGNAIVRLPAGTFTIEAYYTADYWLTPTKANATEQITVSQSTLKQVVLSDYPPAIWTTTGFWLLIIAVIIAAVAVVLFLRKRHRTRPTK
jgi:hypothetical protein